MLSREDEVPAEVIAETGEGAAGDGPAAPEMVFSTAEAASLLGIRREALYSLFYHQRPLFQIERGKGGLL